MTLRTIDHGLVDLALARVDTSAFEQFVHAFGGTADNHRIVPLSNRLKDEVFRKVVSESKEVAKLDDARAGSMLSRLANDLKADIQKSYDHSYRAATQ